MTAPQHLERLIRRFSIALLVIGLAQASASGGSITFVPDSPTVDVGAGDNPLVTFDVFVGSLVGVDDAFTSIDILFGSDDGLELVSFEFEPPFYCIFFWGCDSSLPFGVYANEIKTGFFSVSPTAVTDPVLFGSLTVDTTGLSLGKYEVLVDGDRDGGRSSVTNIVGGDVVLDLLFGVGSVNVVPEPTTISFLGLVSLALIHRRRTA